MIKVKATREGLLGKPTASGYEIDEHVSFVALPSRKALGRFVRVTNPATLQETLAQVLDIGPWNEEDDAYVFQAATSSGAVALKTIRPAAESGKSVSGKGTNGSGIDLGEKVWKALNMQDNSEVLWEFIK